VSKDAGRSPTLWSVDAETFILVHDCTVALSIQRKDQGMGWAASNGKHFPCNKGTSKADNDSGVFKQDEGNTVFVISWKAIMTVKFWFGPYNNLPRLQSWRKFPCSTEA
jgi:hypothetical protein